MKIAGMEKLSLVDYPGLMAAVFFTPGCNLNCFFCHNREIIDRDAPGTWMGPEVALAWLDDRKGFLDAAVITGGEPTLQKGLPEFIHAIRERGYRVKLDTNGTRPDILGGLLRAGLLDYVAMDIKAPPARYAEICGVPVDLGAIDASIRLLIDSGIEYEFRTTVVPQLTHADIATMAQWIRGARRYVLQQFRAPRLSGSFVDFRNTAAPHPPEWPEAVHEAVEGCVTHFNVRGFATRRATRTLPV